MKIDFYEEFPKESNLKKLKLIDFPCRVFFASKSLEEFFDIEKNIKRINKKIDCAYWPIVKNSYWLSPFSNKNDLRELFFEINKINNHVLIDLELPFRARKKLMLKNLFCYFENKKLIKEFLEKNKKRITIAQFPFASIFYPLKFMGLNYDVNCEKSMMWYSSMNPNFVNNKIKRYLIHYRNKPNCSISLGTLATGILGNEPILSPENLKRDLEFVKTSGYEKAIIFRVEGLNQNYMQVIKHYLD
ncbi:MAG: hypothetical protein ACOYT4_04260 [Nanoarchaeota archaeon]